MLTLSFSVCVKYHSHRIISNHKLPGAAVCFWHGTKFGTRQHKLRARQKHACDCMRACLWLLRVLCARVAPSVQETSVPHRTRLHYDITASRSNNGHISPSSSFLSLSLCSFHSCTIQQSLDLNCKANCSTHSWREKKVAEKKKKRSPWQHKERKKSSSKQGWPLL